jgi:two-component system NtrC family sensor kinase
MTPGVREEKMSRRSLLSVIEMSMEDIEDRLLTIERSYEEFFAEARDGFFISTREGGFVDCNDALVNMLGYQVTEEVLTLDLFWDLWMEPQHRERFQTVIETQGQVSNYEAVFRKKDGSLLHVALSAQVWKDRYGEIGGYQGFVVDSTHQRLMEDQLQTIEIKYRELFDNILDGVFISDEEGRVLDCNKALCDIVGYTREEFMGMDYYKDLFASDDDIMDFRKKVTEDGSVRDYELQIRLKDGSIHDISMSGYASKNSAGEIINYQGLMRDVTETKRIRALLIQTESAMGRMASQLAHELNNPIYGIMNCLELLKDAIPESNERRKYLDLAYNECQRTSGLLIKMLKFFKPDNEEKKPTDVNKLLEETLLFYEKQFKNLNIRVNTDLAEDLPHIMAIGSQLKQVFINMIINANTAMPTGGDLRVASSFRPDDNGVAVTIQDSGVGIPPEIRERIFEAFFTTKKKVKGVGLGLSISYGFIREHGGTIDVQSDLGKGTTFKIYLPLDGQKAGPSSRNPEKSDFLRL